MSRVAKNPVAIPEKVEVVLSANSIDISGPLGKLSHPLTDTFGCWCNLWTWKLH